MIAENVAAQENYTNTIVVRKNIGLAGAQVSYGEETDREN